jgi:hypothetical protein
MRRRPALIVEQHRWKMTHIIIAAVLVDVISFMRIVDVMSSSANFFVDFYEAKQKGATL